MDRLIILDFDGVIADTYDLSISILDSLLPSLSKPAFKASLEGTYSSSLVRRLLRWIYSQYFLMRYAGCLRPAMMFGGAPEMLKDLHQAGKVLILTSGRKQPVEKFLAANGLLEIVEEVIGTSSASKQKGLRTILREYNEYVPNQCILVSDTLGDLRVAHMEGLKVIGVAWGFQGKELLQRESFIEVVDTPKNIVKAVDRVFS